MYTLARTVDYAMLTVITKRSLLGRIRTKKKKKKKINLKEMKEEVKKGSLGVPTQGKFYQRAKT